MLFVRLQDGGKRVCGACPLAAVYYPLNKINVQQSESLEIDLKRWNSNNVASNRSHLSTGARSQRSNETMSIQFENIQFENSYKQLAINPN